MTDLQAPGLLLIAILAAFVVITASRWLRR